MNDTSKIDYSALDRPEVLSYLFHPRPEPPLAIHDAGTGEAAVAVKEDILITVEA